MKDRVPMSTSPAVNVFVVVVVVTASLIQQVSGYRPYPDPGPDIPPGQKYCATRRHGQHCCPNRVDTCTAPILSTLCYCDDFCDRTISDCCPDYWSECRGLPPEPFRSTTPRPPLDSQYNNLNQSISVFINSSQHKTTKASLLLKEWMVRYN